MVTKRKKKKKTYKDTVLSCVSSCCPPCVCVYVYVPNSLSLSLSLSPPNFEYIYCRGVFDPKLVLVDDMHPRVNSNVVAVRVSGGGDPGGRSVVKHLGLWEGANCYYCIGNITQEHHQIKKKKSSKLISKVKSGGGDVDLGRNRKFLIYDGIVATNAEPVYHR
jgi:hypothetical protein